MEGSRLEQYYLGDEAWNTFYKVYEDLPDTPIHDELEKILKDITLVKVIENKVGDGALDWIERKIPALDNLRPIDCLQDIQLKKRLKSMLMRM